MTREEEKIVSYREFTLSILPGIVSAGYNTIQLMAIRSTSIMDFQETQV